MLILSMGIVLVFHQAASPEIAEPLYDLFNQKLAATGIPVETGHFGAMMKIDLENDGPTTIIYERSKSKEGTRQKSLVTSFSSPRKQQ